MTGQPCPEGKVGEPLMRPYEVMVILDASLEDDAVRAMVNRFSQQLTTSGAKSVSVHNWGKRRFAYPLQHRNEGYYVVIEANAEPGAMGDLDRLLGLTDEVLRHKVIRLPERATGRSRPAPSQEPTVAVAANTNGA
jgi:small subunit ribosomal protein S6